MMWFFQAAALVLQIRRTYINANFKAQAVKRSFALNVPQIYLKF